MGRPESFLVSGRLRGKPICRDRITEIEFDPPELVPGEAQVMHQITVEPALGQKLSELTDQAILCDANGRALGFFSPLQNRLPVEDLQLEPPLSIAETEELRKVRAGKPLSEILGRLGMQ